MQHNNEEMLIQRLNQSGTKLTRNSLYRLRVFFDWMNSHNISWFESKLEDFKSHLLNERQLSEYDASVYLSTVRSSFRKLLEDEKGIRAVLLEQLPNSEAVDQAINLMRLNSDSRTAQIKAQRPKGSHQHFTVKQIEQYLNSISIESLKGFRDWFILSTFFCTGLRDVEIVSLEVKNFFYVREGKQGLFVPSIDNAPERFVEYGPMDWLVSLAKLWLKKAEIEDGLVFRRIHRNGKLLPTALSSYSIDNLLEEYPIIVDGKSKKLTLLDIRYSYARVMYKLGVDIGVIQRNLGHENLAVTNEYIGDLDGPDKSMNVYRSRIQFILDSLEGN